MAGLKSINMKKLFIFLLLFVSLTIQATTYYVSTSGNDANNGSSGSPFRHLYYACTKATSVGDIITILAGTFSESTQSVLYPGVSIVGQGATSIITGYVGSITSGQIDVSSSAGTSVNGNQSISYIKLDGNSFTAYCGISSWYRNNVEISNCTIINYKDRGVSIQNGGDFMAAPSYSYSSGNSVHDCTITNCGQGTNNWTNDQENACVWWYGQSGFYLYNNVLDNSGQTYNSDIIKCAWHTGTVMNGNTFTKPIGNNGGEWNFYSELFFDIGQWDIYNNTFNGNATLDIVDVRPGAGNWLNIHDNLFTNTNQVVYTAAGVMAIDLEDWGAVQRVNIYKNHFHNQPTGIQFDVVGNATSKTLVAGKVDYEQIYMYYNLFDSEGNSTNTWSPCIDIKCQDTDGLNHVASIYADNNTMISGTGQQSYAGVLLETCSDMTDIRVRNNIIQGFATYPIYYTTGTGTPSGSTHYIQKNLYYNNNSNTASYSGVTGINFSNITAANPLFVSSSDFHLQAGSPAIGAGVTYSTPSVSTDYAGSSINNPPDLGIYKYGAGASAPTVTTTAVTGITTTTSVSGGNVTSDGGASVTVRGVCWGTSVNPTTANSYTTDGSGTGIYTSSITGLSPNTSYHVRAYATNSVNTSYGADVAFTTSPTISLPTVTTASVTSITLTSAVSGGNVTADGGATVTARGICYNTTSYPSIASPHTSDGTGTGSFVSSMTSLTGNTTYYVRAYATNSQGTAYGDQQIFTTTAVTYKRLMLPGGTHLLNSGAGGHIIQIQVQ